MFQSVALNLNVTLADFKFKQIHFKEFTVNGYTILKTIKQFIFKLNSLDQTNVCKHELQAIKPFINKVPNNIFPHTDKVIWLKYIIRIIWDLFQY